MTINTCASEIEAFAMANCRHMLLTATKSAITAGETSGNDNIVEFGRIFRCKTCDRKFSSFQALGGHRASHNKTKPPSALSGEILTSPVKTKVHICPICGQDFSTGQALGGHMRRHRSVVANSTVSGSTVTVENSNSNSDSYNSNNNNNNNNNNNKRSYVEIGKSNVVDVSVDNKRICVELNLDLRLCSWKYDDRKDDVSSDDVSKIEEGGVVEPDHALVIAKEEERDFLNLELRPPINFDISYN